jgi:hypothetical protein
MGNNVLPELHTYFSRSSSLLIPLLSNYHIPSRIKFPAAKELIVLGWDNAAIESNMNLVKFPNVRKIVYLSIYSPDTIIKRFKCNTIWEFYEKKMPVNIHDAPFFTSKLLYNKYCILINDTEYQYDNLQYKSKLYVDLYGNSNIKIKADFLKDQFLQYCNSVYKDDNLLDSSTVIITDTDATSTIVKNSIDYTHAHRSTLSILMGTDNSDNNELQ